MAETLLASLPEQDQTQSLFSVHTAAPAQACFLGWSPSRQGVAARACKGSQRCLHLLSGGRHEKAGGSMRAHTDVREACARTQTLETKSKHACAHHEKAWFAEACLKTPERGA